MHSKPGNSVSQPCFQKVDKPGNVISWPCFLSYMKDVETLLPFFHYVRQQYEQEYNHSRLRCGALGSGDHAIKRRLYYVNIMRK